MVIISLLFVFLICIPWLIFSVAIATLGLFIKANKTKLESEKVKDSQTVCKTLFEKGLLTKDEYDFETNDVAGIYSDQIFTGYLFILSPVIFMLKKSNLIDQIMIFLVKKWIRVHKNKIFNSTQASQVEHLILNICIEIANRVGVVIHFLKFKK